MNDYKDLFNKLYKLEQAWFSQAVEIAKKVHGRFYYDTNYNLFILEVPEKFLSGIQDELQYKCLIIRKIKKGV